MNAPPLEKKEAPGGWPGAGGKQRNETLGRRLPARPSHVKRGPSFVGSPADPMAEAYLLQRVAQEPDYFLPQLWAMPPEAFTRGDHARLYFEILSGSPLSAWAKELAGRIAPTEPTCMHWWDRRDRIFNLWQRREARRQLARADEMLLDPKADTDRIIDAFRAGIAHVMSQTQKEASH